MSSDANIDRGPNRGNAQEGPEPDVNEQDLKLGKLPDGIEVTTGAHIGGVGDAKSVESVPALERQEMHFQSMLGARGFNPDGATLEQMTAAVAVLERLPHEETSVLELGTFGLSAAQEVRQNVVANVLNA